MITSEREPSPWAVICPNQGTYHQGKVYLTHEEYVDQMRHPDNPWRCPVCGWLAEWSDENWNTWDEADCHGGSND